MLKLRSSHVFIILLSFFASCKPTDKAVLTNAVGRPGSLVIVSDASIHSNLKGDLESTFLKTSLPSENEPFLEILKPDIPDFLKLFYNQRTVLVLVSESNYKEMEELLAPFEDEAVQKMINDPNSSFASQKNVFAIPQHIVYLFGKDAADLKNKLNTNSAKLVSALIDFEQQDHNETMLADTGINGKYENIFKEKYGVGVKIPASFKLIKESPNFYWFQQQTTENGTQKNIGLIVHAYPYMDTSDLSYVKIRSIRDTFCKHHIPGELPGTYMSTTESDRYPARTCEMTEINGHKTCKVKGWWTIKGIQMAGPFIRYVVYVAEKQILFAFEGYVYRPDILMKERDLRLIEALALNIK